MEKVKGLFLIIKLRVIIVQNKILKIEIFWGNEVLSCIFSGQKIHVLEILGHQNTHFLIRNSMFESSEALHKVEGTKK